MNDNSACGVLAEVNHLLNAFLEAHGHPASLQHLDKLPPYAASSCASKRFGDFTHDTSDFCGELMQLEWMCAFIGSRTMDVLALQLLSWVQAIERLPLISASLSMQTQSDTKPISMFRKRFGSWLVARLLLAVFDADQLPLASVGTDLLASTILKHCFQVFELEHQSELKRSQHGSGGFLSTFMSSVPALKTSSSTSSIQESDASAHSNVCVQRHLLAQWKLVLGRATRLSPRVARVMLQVELAKPELVANTPKARVARLLSFADGVMTTHSYLHFLSDLPLGLADDVGSSSQCIKDAALLLKSFSHYLGKPFKSRVRHGVAALVSSLLRRELDSMTRVQFQSLLLHPPVSEWNSCVSELHSLALKLSQKRKTLVVGWELRVLVLALAPTDIFGRYWKEDMQALLRLQYRYGKDGGGIGISNVSGISGSLADSSSGNFVSEMILQCVERSFTNLILRHLLSEGHGGSPTESDCMEILNTVQAWCFFSPYKQKNFAKFNSNVVPILSDISVTISAFNMRYAVQSHLRRLLTEADEVIDRKKLIGLKVLLVICRNCTASNPPRVSTGSKQLWLTLDAHAFMEQLGTLGEIAGHILILCNTHLGHDLLFDQLSSVTTAPHSAFFPPNQKQVSSTTSWSQRDESKYLLAIEIFSSALCSLEFVYDQLELRGDQKVLLLARASVHKHQLIRSSASKTLEAITSSTKFAQAGAILRGLTDYLVGMTSNHTQANDAEPLTLLVNLCSTLLRAATSASFRHGAVSICWESESTVRESFLQVEAASVFLLTHTAVAVRVAAIDALSTVKELRGVVTAFSESQNNGEQDIVEAVSALQTIESLEPILKERFFTFQPSTMNNKKQELKGIRAADELWHFKQLANDWGDSRHSFRWSMCLSLVFQALATELPQLMTYFWSDANSKVSKLEPVIASFNDSHIHRFDSDISRWRNLSILATASACPTLVLAGSVDSTPQSSPSGVALSCPTAQNAISTVAIVALLKRLGRYLKSASVEQQKVAIVALGATHRLSRNFLSDILSRCEADAFFEGGENQLSNGKSPSRTDSFEALVRPILQHSQEVVSTCSAARRYSKSQSKGKSNHLKNQLQIQWALLRCHRLLLESALASSCSTTTTDQCDNNAAKVEGDASEHELMLSAASSFLVRMANALDAYSAGIPSDEREITGLLDGIGGHMIFMIQQDFSGTVQLLLNHLMGLDSNSLDAYSNNGIAGDGYSTNDEEERPEEFKGRRRCRAVASFVSEARAVQWVKSLLSWCVSFGTLADSTMSEHLDGIFFTKSSALNDIWISSCDVFGICEAESGQTLPWIWFDEGLSTCFKSCANQDSHNRRNGYYPALTVTSSTRFLRFFTCGCAFSTLISLIGCSRFQFLRSDFAERDFSIFCWLDECFAVDTTRSSTHFCSLQKICRAAVKRFLDADRDGIFRSICIEKSCFRKALGTDYAIAKQYMLAIGAQTHQISAELLDASNNISRSITPYQIDSLTGSSRAKLGDSVHFVYALLLHLGVAVDPNDSVANDLHRKQVNRFIEVVLSRDNTEIEQRDRWLGSLAVSVPRESVVLTKEMQNRIQVAAASALASAFPGLRFAVCVATFRLIHRCDVYIQRNMLGAVLPLLMDAKLGDVSYQCGHSGVEPMRSALGDSVHVETLLELMFKLTLSINGTCAEQLDRVWLTLVYSSAHQSIESNLRVILAFLVKKCNSPAETATAKLIVWWLARWQDAAVSVVNVLCHYMETQALGTRENQQDPDQNEGGISTAALIAIETPSLDKIAIMVGLASMASCHLQQSSTKMFKELIFQTVHFALLLHFSTPSIPDSSTRNDASQLSNSKLQLESVATAPQIHVGMSASTRRDCVVLLQTMGQFLMSATASDVFDNAMSALVSCIDDQAARDYYPRFSDTLSTIQNQPDDLNSHDTLKTFLSCLESLTQCLTIQDAAVWSEICVKEIALALSIASSSSSEHKFTISASIQARFAVIMYGFLTPEFNGDVFLAILDVLHISLDEHLHDPAAYEPLICNCLALLARMMEKMPDSKLALYPQVFWVCTALLNHFSASAAHETTLELLYSMIRKPALVMDEILVDVISCKRPAQWSAQQSSVLYALASTLHIGSRRARTMVIEMVAHCSLMLPEALLMMTETERAIVCSIGLLPILAFRVPQAFGRLFPDELLENACNDIASQWEHFDVAHVSSTSDDGFTHNGATATQDLAAFFQDRANSFKLPQRYSDDCLMRPKPGCPSDDALDTTVTRETMMSFARAYLPVASVVKRCGKISSDGLSLTFDIITRMLSATTEGTRVDFTSNPDDRELMLELDANAFALAEELVVTIMTTGIQWHPPPSFVSTLTRIARRPQRRSTWQSAVRLLTILSTETAHSEMSSIVTQQTARPSAPNKLATVPFMVPESTCEE